MATVAHCAFCFEVLTAKLERREPLSLSQVEHLWQRYEAGEDDYDDDDDPSEPLPSDMTPPAAVPPNALLDPSYRPAAISRLMANTSSSASSSSVQSTISTPSRVSEASSATTASSKSSNSDDEPALEEEYPLFVTYNTLHKVGRRWDKRLRGCIGTFEPQELESGLRSYALTSAFDDRRFPSIRPSELPSLECSVTLLTDFEPVLDPFDWTIGVHGLRISFVHDNHCYGATYLPDVAKEQGWTKEETLVSLMRKAGWDGPTREWREVELKVVRYKGVKERLGYAEWVDWRAWME
ncbi:ammecr1 family protein, partial [Westerdykella ornata]